MVCQGSGVTAAVPFQLHALRSVRVFGHKAGNGRVTLYACFHAVVAADELAIQRVCCADNAFNGIITAGTDMIEVLITLTDYGFPNQHLRCHCLCQRCGIAGVLRAPGTTDRSRIAVLHSIFKVREVFALTNQLGNLFRFERTKLDFFKKIFLTAFQGQKAPITSRGGNRGRNRKSPLTEISGLKSYDYFLLGTL